MIRYGLLLALGLLIGGYAYLRFYERMELHRYRVEIRVDTPSGVRVGSSVMEESSRKLLFSLSGNKISSRLRGEAVAIDLPNGQTMFALLNNEGGDIEMPSMIGRALRPLRKARASGDANTSLYASAGLPMKQPDFPMLVRFRDQNDQTSIERVDPSDLATVFGSGYTLKQITVQETDDPPTFGLERRLRWLPRLEGSLVKASWEEMSGDPPFGARIHDGYFSTERFQ